MDDIPPAGRSYSSDFDDTEDDASDTVSADDNNGATSTAAPRSSVVGAVPPHPQNLDATLEDAAGVATSTVDHTDVFSLDENILCDLMWGERWDEVTARMNTEEGREDLRRKNEWSQHPLHRACGWNDAPSELVEVMLREYPEAVRVTDNVGRLPLHWACDHYSDICVRVVRLLLAAYPEGAKATDRDGYLPLHYAVRNNAQLEVFRMLLDVHPEGAATGNEDGDSPLHLLAKKASHDKMEDAEKVELLLAAYPAGAKATNREGRLPLHDVADANALLGVLRMLLKAHPEGAAVRDKDGELPLHLFAKKASSHKVEDVEKVELLIRPLLNNTEACRGTMKGNIPLHIAVQFGLSVDIFRALLGTYPEGAATRLSDGDLPLHLLAKKASPDKAEDVEKVELLIRPLLNNEEACQEIIRLQHMHMLHLAAKFGVSVDIVQSLLGMYPECAKEMTEVNAMLAIHMACSRGDTASPRVVKVLCDAYPGGAKTADWGGGLPLHWAASTNAPLEVLKIIVKANPEGVTARNKLGKLPLHLLAKAASPEKVEDVEKVNMLIRPLLGDKETCRRGVGDDRVLPLHVASKFGLSIDVFVMLLETYGDAAKETCRHLGKDVYALDLLEMLRRVHGTAEDESFQVVMTSETALPLVGSSSGAIAAGTTPGGSATSEFALLGQVDDAPDSTDILDDANLEFNEKSDLLFSYNPDIPRHRKDDARLKRLINLIIREARERSLSDTSRRVWLWMCMFSNTEDPGDDYVEQINTILDGLRDRKLVEWLASVETPGVRQIREIAAPTCAKAINAHFLFAGRLELSHDHPIHKSATCIVVEAKDFGDPAVSIEQTREKTKLNKYERVVVKFMSDAKQFDREICARSLSSSTRCSDHSDYHFVVPCITFFDTRESSPMDENYRRDIHESRHVFGHDLLRYPYALVMQRGDRNLDSIFMQEEPRILKIRSYMEEVAVQLEKFHDAGRIHADIKPLNIVRLDGVLTLIDIDASREIGTEKVGTKFSSGVLPPEMIHQLKNETEEDQYAAYWKDEVGAFNLMQRIIVESNEKVPDAISELLEEIRGTGTGHVDIKLELYCEKSSTLDDIFRKAGRNMDTFYGMWTRLTMDAALWEKLRPRRCRNGTKYESYVVKAFRHGYESGLPYETVPADIAFDMWSFGVLLYKLCTKKLLFSCNITTDDLDSGESYAELAKWDLSRNACREKLNTVTNKSALDLLQFLLSKSAGDRPKRMREILCHEFFEADFHTKWNASNEELRRLQGEAQRLHHQQNDTSHEREKRVLLERQLQDKNQQIRHVKEELKEMINAMTASQLIRCRKWGAVRKKISEASGQKDLKDLFFEACRHGPPFEIVNEFLRINEDLPLETKNDELPIHLACCYGAETKVIVKLIHRHPKSLTKGSGLDEDMIPLRIAQASPWKFNNRCHIEVVELLRRETFPKNFDSMTDLPTKAAFDEWAKIPSPGMENCNAYAILLFLDVSGFKAVNDRASYAEGDSALRMYSTAVANVCRKYVESSDADLQLTIECFRIGGDEFAIVGKFAGDEFGSPVMDVWDTSFKQLVNEIASLEVNDTRCPPRYSTFFRVGCCGGRASQMKQLLEKAEELQKDVKEEIGVQRGDSVSLAAIRANNIRNFSDFVVL